MFKVVWDKENNGVRLTMSSAGEALNIAPRPVFHEELDLFGLDKMGWKYIRSKAPLLWACERRYFYKGVCVMEIKGGNVFDEPTVQITPEGKGLSLEPINLNALEEVNEDSMFILEHEAINFISDTYRRYKSLAAAAKKNPDDVDFIELADIVSKKTKEEHVVIKESCDSFDIMPLSDAEKKGKAPILTSRAEMFVASFSGGKDSQVTLDLVSRVIPPEDFLVIYSDTGYELPSSLELYEDVKEYYKQTLPGLRFYTAKNHQEVLHYWDEMGSPSNLHRWCCGVMKTAPLYIALKEIFGKGRQPHVVSMIGTRAEESLRRANYERIAKDAKHTNVLNVSPILEWNSTEVWLYLLFHHLPCNMAYRKGLGRVGCIICPFGSDWNDYLCNKIFPATARPFLDKIREIATKRGVKDVEDYVRSGNWKIRAGGTGSETSSSVIISSQRPDFKAILNHPKEDIFEWIKTLGKYQIVKNGNSTIYDVRYNKDHLYQVIIKQDLANDSLHVEVPNVDDDILFVSHLKRIINKVTYCVHCELCEVECPTGALVTHPKVKVDANKCIKCHKCLDFKDNGCITANSLKQAEGLKIAASAKGQKTTINRYNNFGFRDAWLSFYLGHFETYFDNDDHGLNKQYQLPPFMNWLRDSEIMANDSKQITDTGRLLAEKYESERIKVWECIWINLFHNSEICYWYANNADFTRPYTKDELEKLLADTLPQYSPSVRKNAFGSFQNALISSPLGNELMIGVVTKENNNPIITRSPYNQLSLAGVAYSLYRYAEKVGRKSLTISELYNENQTEGIYRQFGIDRNSLEKKLRSLHEEGNQVLKVELMMGLDNITLREDLTSLDILKMLL